MKGYVLRITCVTILVAFIWASSAFSAYNLEVPVEPWDEYRMQFKDYSKYLFASYDRAFVDDFEGAIREVDKAIELLPEEGLGFAERSKYNRILHNTGSAESDFKTALALFAQAIDKYRPDADRKIKNSKARRTSPADASRLIATLRYQRGEAYFNFEQYRQASNDFASACQGGNSVACSRMWDVKAIEKRGVEWIPLTARQYYDRKRVEYPSPSIVRVWLRREEFQPVRVDNGLEENHVQQHVELNCSTREFRLIEALVVTDGSRSPAEKTVGTGFAKPMVGSAQSRLLISLCPRNQSKR